MGHVQIPLGLSGDFFGFGDAVVGDGERGPYLVRVDAHDPEPVFCFGKAPLGGGDPFGPAVRDGVRDGPDGGACPPCLRAI
jgi:hypothetical protein